MTKSFTKIIVQFIAPYKFYFLWLTMLSATTALCQVVHPFLTKIIINLVEQGHGIKSAFIPGVLFVLSFEINNLCWRGINLIR